MTDLQDLLVTALAVTLCSSVVVAGAVPVGATSAPGDVSNDAPPLAADLGTDPVAQVSENDEDGDGIPDDEDPFPLDPDNGLSTSPPTSLDFETDASDPLNSSVGFTGVMANGSDFRALYDPANVTVANGTLTVEPVQPTDAFSTTNTQESAFQFGTTTPADRPFEVHATLPNAFGGETPVPFQNYGVYVGDGTQANYTKLVVGARQEADADGEIELLSEEDDQVVETAAAPDSSVVGGDVDLYLTVDPTTDPTPGDGSDDVALTAEYAVDGGERVAVGDGPIPIPAAWLADDDRGLAVGVINTAAGSGETYAATYDSLEVTALEPPAPAENASATLSVTPGAGIDASNFDAGSYTLENTGDVPITSVTVDQRSALFTDLVYDPAGTAGDQAFKCFEADAGASTVGLLTSGDGQGDSSCVAPFGSPHDGNASDGYDTLTVEFDDFDPGETFSFSTDSDPTSIKGAQAPGPGDSGSVNGLELAGSSVTVEYADGTTQTVRTFDDGAATPGGAVAAASNATDAATSPTLEVQGVTLDSSVLDVRHSGAAVPGETQTVRVTGAPANATVRLVRVEGALFLEDADNPSTNVSGYDVEPFEANTALNRDVATVTADASGEATATVTLENSTAEGGLNYLAAAVVENGTPGAVSNVVVLRLDANASTAGPPALPGFENAPTDPDGDGVYEDVNGNGEFTLADVTALFENREDPAVTGNAAAYDVNGNGEFTLSDVTALFEAAATPAP